MSDKETGADLMQSIELLVSLSQIIGRFRAYYVATEATLEAMQKRIDFLEGEK